MIDQAITVSDTEIYIRAEYFCRRDNTCAHKDILADILTQQYQDQEIKIRAGDGENLIATGLLTLIYEFCELLDIPMDKVKIQTHDTNLQSPFVFEYLPLGIFNNAGTLIPEFDRQLVDPKFAGLVIGRATADRLRLAYSLDQTFPDDTYMVLQTQPRLAQQVYLNFENLYQAELTWLTNKQFDVDIASTSPVGAVGFDHAYQNYPGIWGNFEIEVVAETDSVSGFWFTEKTAKCLATGKPFLLLNGHGTLARLKAMGFETFDSVIDESYDLKFLPTQRIESIVNSLKMLYNDKNRSEKIKEMYAIADRNRLHFKKHLNSQGRDV
jgi:hypothetical protein